MTSFAELGLAEPLVRAVRETGYTTPTPIQLQGIPPVLAGRDVLGCAQTGTGKTAAFTLPILHRLLAKPLPRTGGPRPIRCLILAPTRELAAQIGDNLKDYGKHSGMRHAVIFGGVGQGPQVSALRSGIDILVACPGRLLDLMNQGHCRLNALEVFVLDEADRMLDMGFIHDIRKVVAKVPPQRQTLLFSATMPKEIRALANTLLRDPVEVEVARVSSTAEGVDQSVCLVAAADKPQLLEALLRDPGCTRSIVFTRTKHGADKVAKRLVAAGIVSEAIHGNKSQNARIRAMEGFRSGRVKVLVASDIAARGIDIDEISHVFNYEIPNEPETYVHRIGRTARAGATGVAIALCAPDELAYLRGIERLTKKLIPLRDHPWAGRANQIAALVGDGQSHQHGHGGRSSGHRDGRRDHHRRGPGGGGHGGPPRQQQQRPR